MITVNSTIESRLNAEAARRNAAARAAVDARNAANAETPGYTHEEYPEDQTAQSIAQHLLNKAGEGYERAAEKQTADVFFARFINADAETKLLLEEAFDQALTNAGV